MVQSMKVHLRHLCLMKLNWDDAHCQLTWEKWLKELYFKIPRCYQPAKFGNLISSRIHIFSDASEQSFMVV